MRTIATDGIVWSVCVVSHVCRSQLWALQNTWADQDAMLVIDSGGPKEPWLGIQIPNAKGNFLGDDVRIFWHIAEQYSQWISPHGVK